MLNKCLYCGTPCSGMYYKACLLPAHNATKPINIEEYGKPLYWYK